MFEIHFEDMTATVFVEHGAAALASKYGVTELQPGDNKLGWAEALTLISKFDRIQPGVPKRFQKRWQAQRNQICFAFGPDMEAAVGCKS
jgi:hypothetical protein